MSSCNPVAVDAFRIYACTIRDRSRRNGITLPDGDPLEDNDHFEGKIETTARARRMAQLRAVRRRQPLFPGHHAGAPEGAPISSGASRTRMSSYFRVLRG
ncbi:hypothetical protein ACFWAY_51470 [Rhodococcus sp. NPDC059968]|uniref:hypothetical protein n=1 Tax=Rhodococcus sp. NPDC059968 TaxID=3347017 RepID=UPI003671B46E